MRNLFGRILLGAEFLIERTRQSRSGVWYFFKRHLLPQWWQDRLTIRGFSKFVTAIHAMKDDDCHFHLNWRYCSVYLHPEHSSVKEIKLKLDDRRALVALIESAIQEPLSFRDSLRTDLEVLRAAACVVKGGFAWCHGIRLDGEKGWCEYGDASQTLQNRFDTKQWFEPIRKELVHGGLVAFLNAYILTWEATTQEREIAYLEKEVTHFLKCWERAADIFGVAHPSREDVDTRTHALIKKSREARQGGESPWYLLTPY